MRERPNFLIVVADQLRADALGAFGNERASTPHLDSLAARGTRFVNAYAQHSVCSPSRASFLTGWYPHVRGHRTLTHLLGRDEPNLLRYLKDGGYHVTWIGDRGDTFAPGATEVSCHEYGFPEPHVSTWDEIWSGRSPDDPMTRAFYIGRRGDSLDFDERAVRLTESWLTEPPADPWTLYVPLMFPHCPFMVEEPWFSLHDRDRVPSPRPPGRGREPRYMEAIREEYGTTRLTEDQWREIVATYYGMVSRLDWQVGRMLDALDRSGRADNTVVLFFSDHGEYLGDFGLVEKWPSGLHDCLLREPFIMAGPGVPRGESRDAMVEMVDVLPTLLAMAGIEATHTHFGHSLVSLLERPDSPHRDYAFSEGGFTTSEGALLERAPFPYDLKAGLQHADPTLVGKAVVIRSRDWTYVWRLYEPAELYRRNDDPDERNNLSGLPEVIEVESELRDAVLRWLVATSDVIPWEGTQRFPEVDLPPPTGATG